MEKSDIPKFQVELAKVRSELGEMEAKWADFYIETGDGFKAAVRAGVTMDDAKLFASRVACNDKVVEYLNMCKDLYNAEKMLTEDDILRIWGGISNDEDLKTSDRLKATELLARAKGMFKFDDAVGTQNFLTVIGNDQFNRILKVAEERIASRKSSKSIEVAPPVVNSKKGKCKKK